MNHPGREVLATVPRPANLITVKEDREGSLWIGTRGGGLSQLKPRVVELLTTGSAIPFEPVQSVCQDTDGLLWAIAWPNGRLLRSTGQGWIPMSTNDGWSVPISVCVAADPRGAGHQPGQPAHVYSPRLRKAAGSFPRPGRGQTGKVTTRRRAAALTGSTLPITTGISDTG